MPLTIMILTILFQLTSSRAIDFNYDENGKIVFVDVVASDLGYDTLIDNALSFMRSEKEKVKDQNIFNKQQSFMLYDKRLSKVPHGELRFNVQIEVKEGKFRYVISDLVFHEFARNRYGRFEEMKNAEAPLEKILENPDRDWKTHETTILNKLDKVIENIKNQMANLPEAVEEQKTVKVSDDW